MLLLLHVNVMCVSAILSHVAASISPHYCSVNIAMLPLLYVAVIVCKSCVCVSVIVCNVVNVTAVVV